MNVDLRVPTSAAQLSPLTDQRLRILLIGINYAPELTGIGPYTTELAEHFSRAGHQVHVITGIPHYPEWRPLTEPPVDGSNGVSVKRFRHFIPRRANALGRMLYEFTWLVSASRGLVRGTHDIALGVVPSLSGGLLAVVAGGRWNIPSVLIIKDLMGPAAAQSGYRGGSRVAWMTGIVERWIIRRAYRVAIISDGFRPYLRQSGVAAERIHRVRDWAHPGEPSESPRACRLRLGWRDDEFICLHAGNMGQKQGLDNILAAAALLQGTGAKIVLAGDGNDKTRLMERARSLPAADIIFLNLQPAGRYEAMLRAADVLVVNQRASVAEMSLPSKLASYFASGRPVIAAVARSSPTAREVAEAEAGIVVEPEQPRALADAILRLKDEPALAKELGSRGSAYAERNLAPATALDLYDKLLREFVSEHSSFASQDADKSHHQFRETGGHDGMD